MKALWQGFMALGQLTFPIKLYSATKEIRPKFVQIHESDQSPIERIIRCQAEGKEITSDEIVRAVEKGKGKYVVVSDQEIARSAGSRDKLIEMRQFSDPNAIDPIFYEKPYYIVPEAAGIRAYVLLREALIRGAKIGVAQFVFYNKEHIGVIRPLDGILMLHQLRFASEIVPRQEIKTPTMPPPHPAELSAALAVLNHLSGPFFIDDYRDEHTEQLLDTIERKAKGLKPAPRPKRVLAATPDIDLLSVLKRSLLGEGEVTAN